MITLSIQSITDEIFALTALRRAVAVPAEELANTSAQQTAAPTGIPAALSRDNMPALRIMAATAFCSVVARLMPYVADCSSDATIIRSERPFSDAEPMTLGIDFGRWTASMSGGAIMVLKRYLEHLIALLVLHRVYLPYDKAQAEVHVDAAWSVLSVIRDMLASPEAPSLISPCYY